MKVRWSTAAKLNLAEIVDFIAIDNPRAAIQMDELLSGATGRLADFPNSGRQGLLAGTRELLPHRSYRIVYDFDAGMVRILAVVHTSRQWPPVEHEGDH
ncbi:type II toxin-antitoxin system RelE/ParE family toxin [Mesorhizobium sp. CGMCC 1.15528]|uniref:Type II toxin-antitoxin system RelE/ParE family toxin n=1 Tax=Mesorhizobium zhangyense TaxID=1776730 RepID=A0A7C9VEJ2_9HYPH|nr:type II toxin-antitoxin system RelE/ParE family toxin [Mesorhizobium zhangyense]NGN42771.1 type II toxin-antitoxin system RelE/ParE family toxin [Mesorhizobium zhangyense]